MASAVTSGSSRSPSPMEIEGLSKIREHVNAHGVNNAIGELSKLNENEAEIINWFFFMALKTQRRSS